ncbi:MAG: CbiX/SirB N-terminal domain-containing protein [Burkholderiales bacterium]
MPAPGLILFAHGARDPRWAEPFERLKRKVEAVRPGVRVALAYLEFMRPDLETAADALVGSGCRSLRIVPVFLGQGGHVREDLPAVVARVRARHPGVAIEMRTAVGEDDAVLDQIAATAVAGLAG